MSNEHTPEPGGSKPDTLSSDTSQAHTANPFRVLQTGALALDGWLRDARVPRGSLVNLEFEKDQHPTPFLLALCHGALLQGGRAVFLSLPFIMPKDEDEDEDVEGRPEGNDAENDDQHGDPAIARELDYGFEAGLDDFGLAPFFNAKNPADPAAALRYLVATSFDEVKDTIDDLLTAPAQAPALVVVSGLDLLFGHLPLFANWPVGWDREVEGVIEASDHVRRWLQTVQTRAEAVGTTLYLSRSRASYLDTDGTLFTRGLRSLLQARCRTTLFVEETRLRCDCGQCPWSIAGLRGVPIALYQGDTLLTRTLVAVLEGADEDAGMGPFLEAGSEPQKMAAFEKAWQGDA